MNKEKPKRRPELERLILGYLEEASSAVRMRAVTSLRESIQSVLEAQIQVAYDFLWESVRTLQIMNGTATRKTRHGNVKEAYKINREAVDGILDVMLARLDAVDVSLRHVIFLAARERSIKSNKS